MSHLSLEATKYEAVELAQEKFLSDHSEIAPLKLRWRSQCLKHFFHIVPGERILQIGAGSGLWTGELASALNCENEIIAAVFSPALLRANPALPNVRFMNGRDLDSLASNQFDYVVGSSVCGSALSIDMLAFVYRVLKPGGQVFFFEPNSDHPRRKLSGRVRRSASLPSRFQISQWCFQAGFLEVELAPYDIVPWNIKRKAAQRVQAKAVLLEHAPMFKELAGFQYVAARKPGMRTGRLSTSLTEHKSLEGAVSVVVPCRNEAVNIPNLVDQLIGFYSAYIREVLIVNDNSSDNTAEVVKALSFQDERIKLIDRSMPNGVGRALRDGYQAASGRYILSMDCDFVSILPEFRGLFDAIADGYDGAIGSRFSHDSIVLHYPFSKMVCNRLFHLLVRMLVKSGVRDVTNNLKLYRADIFKLLTIRSPHFSANLETGLKPLLEGYRIREVPISWIDRTTEMGKSSFNLRKVGGDYVRAFVDIWKTYRLSKKPRNESRPHLERASLTGIPEEELQDVCKQ